MRSERAVPRLTALRVAGPVLLSLAVLVVVAHLTFDPAAYRAVARRLDPWLAAAALGTIVVRVVFGGWRLDYLADGRLGLRSALRVQLIWDFLAYVTPSTVGGGPFVPVVMARERPIPVGEATSVILFAILLEQLGFVATILVVLAALPFVEVIPAALGVVGYWSILVFFGGFALWVLVFGYGTLVRPQLLAKVVDVVLRLRWLRRFRARAAGMMDDFQEQARALRSRRPAFHAKAFVLTIVPWLSRYALMVFVAWSVYPALDRLPAFLRAAALHLSSMALPLPGGAGGVEALYVAFFGPPLLPRALVAPTLLVWRLLSYYAFLVVGSYFALRHLRRSKVEVRSAK